MLHGEKLLADVKQNTSGISCVFFLLLGILQKGFFLGFVKIGFVNVVFFGEG